MTPTPLSPSIAPIGTPLQYLPPPLPFFLVPTAPLLLSFLFLLSAPAHQMSLFSGVRLERRPFVQLFLWESAATRKNNFAFSIRYPSSSLVFYFSSPPKSPGKRPPFFTHSRIIAPGEGKDSSFPTPPSSPPPPFSFFLLFLPRI